MITAATTVNPYTNPGLGLLSKISHIGHPQEKKPLFFYETYI